MEAGEKANVLVQSKKGGILMSLVDPNKFFCFYVLQGFLGCYFSSIN